MTKKIAIVLLLINLQLIAQKTKNPEIGSFTSDELKMTTYPKDTTATAVVLFERADVKFMKENHIYLKKSVYKRIKIFKKEGAQYATFNIPVYNDEKGISETVNHIKAVTYNQSAVAVHLNPEQVYTKRINDHWSEVSFTLPNIKDGSVLEVKYDLDSPFFFNLSGWSFQSDIPKEYSEFHALIPAFWRYNGTVTGIIPFSKKESKLTKNCFDPGNGVMQSCEEITYSMKDIPALQIESSYTTTSKNYKAHIEFELAEVFYLDGSSKKYTSSWEDTDKRLKFNPGIGRELGEESFFEKKLPAELFNEPIDLVKAKNIYYYLQDYYTLDGKKKYLFDKNDVKKAFTDKIGSEAEINLGLINALNAAGLNSKVFLSSTRESGHPTKLHPVITDFNSLFAYVKIGKEEYLLDASQKQLEFGMLPFEALNSHGRVMDFDQGSFWLDIVPKDNLFSKKEMEMTVGPDGKLMGTLKEIDRGYQAMFVRRFIAENSEKDYLAKFVKSNGNLEVINYENSFLDDLEKPLVQNMLVGVDASEIIGNQFYLNPFIDKTTENPFRLDKRIYPVDFGVQMDEIFAAKIEVPEGFTIKSIPESTGFKLPNNGGAFICQVSHQDNLINLYYRINLLKTIYQPQEYAYLKEFYKRIIDFQNSFIILEKTEPN